MSIGWSTLQTTEGRVGIPGRIGYPTSQPPEVSASRARQRGVTLERSRSDADRVSLGGAGAVPLRHLLRLLGSDDIAKRLAVVLLGLVLRPHHRHRPDVQEHPRNTCGEPSRYVATLSQASRSPHRAADSIDNRRHPVVSLQRLEESMLTPS